MHVCADMYSPHTHTRTHMVYIHTYIHTYIHAYSCGSLTLFRVATGDGWGELLASTQISPGPRIVDKESWKDLTGLLGYDPSQLDPSRAEFFTMDDSDAPYKVLRLAVQNWFAEAKGLERDADWPFPASARNAQSWIILARKAMPGCLDDGEVIRLEKEGLANCDTDDGFSKACVGTCGDAIVANIYFCAFVCIAAFVLLQLVISILLDRLNASEDEATANQKLMPGAKVLRQDVFNRIYRRWRYNAAHKLRLQRKLARINAENRSPSPRSPPPRRPSHEVALVTDEDPVRITSYPHNHRQTPAEPAMLPDTENRDESSREVCQIEPIGGAEALTPRREAGTTEAAAGSPEACSPARSAHSRSCDNGTVSRKPSSAAPRWMVHTASEYGGTHQEASSSGRAEDPETGPSRTDSALPGSVGEKGNGSLPEPKPGQDLTTDPGNAAPGESEDGAESESDSESKWEITADVKR
jgi:hypothetical protein